jgi:penicillin-binding protein activator
MRMELTMNRTSLYLPLLAALTLAGCSTERAFTKGEYTDPNEIDLLSDEWAPSDLQLIAKKIVGDLQQSPVFAQIQGRPVVVVGKLKNSTSEHIDMQSLADKVQTQLSNTGKFAFTDRASRQDVAEEYEYQGSGYVRPDQAKGPGQQIAADYIMTGELASIKQRVGSDEFIYYKMTAKLTNLRTGLLEWTDEKELKKKFQKQGIRP